MVMAIRIRALLPVAREIDAADLQPGNIRAMSSLLKLAVKSSRQDENTATAFKYAFIQSVYA